MKIRSGTSWEWRLAGRLKKNHNRQQTRMLSPVENREQFQYFFPTHKFFAADFKAEPLLSSLF
jgi:hypothetical protein